MSVKRTYWHQKNLDDPDNPTNKGQPFKRGKYHERFGFKMPPREMVDSEEEANLVASFTRAGRHAPAIDIDVPVRLVPSKTPGHGHLFFDVEMEWDDYLDLLTALAYAGLVEPAYVEASKKAGMSFLRTKPEERPER